MLAFLAGRFERLLWGAAAIVIAVALARLLKWAVHRLEQRRPGEERELLQLRRRETAIVLVATAIPYATAIVVLVVVASIFVSRNAAALGGTATFRPEGSIKGSIPGPRSRTCKSTRKRKRRFPALLQNPLTDSNPRPPPTMEGVFPQPLESACGCKHSASIELPPRCHRVSPKRTVAAENWLGACISAEYGGTQSRRLITRRSQVQILPRYCGGPWKRGLSLIRRAMRLQEGATARVRVRRLHCSLRATAGCMSAERGVSLTPEGMRR